MSKTCTKGNKKSAKLVRGLDGKMHCVRFGDPNMTIKKDIPGRKKSFCARHRCSSKVDPATPGYQSCLAWNCKMTTTKSKNRHRRPQRRRSRHRSRSRRIRRTSTSSRKKSSKRRRRIARRLLRGR